MHVCMCVSMQLISHMCIIPVRYKAYKDLKQSIMLIIYTHIWKMIAKQLLIFQEYLKIYSKISFLKKTLYFIYHVCKYIRMHRKSMTTNRMFTWHVSFQILHLYMFLLLILLLYFTEIRTWWITEKGNTGRKKFPNGQLQDKCEKA